MNLDLGETPDALLRELLSSPGWLVARAGLQRHLAALDERIVTGSYPDAGALPTLHKLQAERAFVVRLLDEPEKVLAPAPTNGPQPPRRVAGRR